MERSSPMFYPLKFIFIFFYVHYLVSNSLLSIFFPCSFYISIFLLGICLFGYIFTLSTFYLEVMVPLMEIIYSMNWVSTHLRIQLIGTNEGLTLNLMEIEGQLFNYLNNRTTLNCIGGNMLDGRRNKGD